MPVQKNIPYDFGHFFITFTCFKWLPLIEITNSYDLVYKWFDYLKSRGHFITGNVIMPNHLHATIAFRKTNKSINKIVGDGKRFMAYEIIKRLEQNGEIVLLTRMQNAVHVSDKKRGKLHEVWEDSFDWKECNNEHFIIQKLNYMHANPFAGKWKLSINAVDYPHSSAKFYIAGEQGIYPVINYKELDDINLSKTFLI